jgi:hypothetical protein
MAIHRAAAAQSGRIPPRARRRPGRRRADPTPTSFADEVREAILRRLREAIARGEDPLVRLVRDEIEAAYARTQKETR